MLRHYIDVEKAAQHILDAEEPLETSLANSLNTPDFQNDSSPIFSKQRIEDLSLFGIELNNRKKEEDPVESSSDSSSGEDSDAEKPLDISGVKGQKVSQFSKLERLKRQEVLSKHDSLALTAFLTSSQKQHELQMQNKFPSPQQSTRVRNTAGSLTQEFSTSSAKWNEITGNLDRNHLSVFGKLSPTDIQQLNKGTKYAIIFRPLKQNGKRISVLPVKELHQQSRRTRRNENRNKGMFLKQTESFLKSPKLRGNISARFKAKLPFGNLGNSVSAQSGVENSFNLDVRSDFSISDDEGSVLARDLQVIDKEFSFMGGQRYDATSWPPPFPSEIETNTKLKPSILKMKRDKNKKKIKQFEYAVYYDEAHVLPPPPEPRIPSKEEEKVFEESENMLMYIEDMRGKMEKLQQEEKQLLKAVQKLEIAVEEENGKIQELAITGSEREIRKQEKRQGKKTFQSPVKKLFIPGKDAFDKRQSSLNDDYKTRFSIRTKALNLN
eukprot:maker-scaffold_10-snap-gene-10.38-mRNA-1 protein AED:0.00 eAED:0.00 QI:41/1/1/1/1/1/2/176/494